MNIIHQQLGQWTVIATSLVTSRASLSPLGAPVRDVGPGQFVGGARVEHREASHHHHHLHQHRDKGDTSWGQHHLHQATSKVRLDQSDQKQAGHGHHRPQQQHQRAGHPPEGKGAFHQNFQVECRDLDKHHPPCLGQPSRQTSPDYCDIMPSQHQLYSLLSLYRPVLDTQTEVSISIQGNIGRSARNCQCFDSLEQKGRQTVLLCHSFIQKKNIPDVRYFCRLGMLGTGKIYRR